MEGSDEAEVIASNINSLLDDICTVKTNIRERKEENNESDTERWFVQRIPTGNVHY